MKEKVLVAGSWSVDRKEVGEELWGNGFEREMRQDRQKTRVKSK